MTLGDPTVLSKMLKSVFTQEKFAVLTTCSADSRLHSTVVCFVSADDLKSVLFVTPKETRKYANLVAGGDAVLFIDTRAEDKDEIDTIYGIEARGNTHMLESPGLYKELYLHRFPDLADFAESTASAWFRMSVDIYDIVHRFQEVVQFFPKGRE